MKNNFLSFTYLALPRVLPFGGVLPLRFVLGYICIGLNTIYINFLFLPSHVKVYILFLILRCFFLLS